MERKILSLVGAVADGDLDYVDTYVGCDLGIFIPSVGHCGYALRKGHTHPAFSFVLFPDTGMDFLFGGKYVPGPGEYLAAAISPGVPHQEEPGEEHVSYYAVMVGEALCERLAAESAIPYCGDWRPFFVPKTIMPLLHTFMAEAESAGGILVESLEAAVAATLMRNLRGAGVQTVDLSGPYSPAVQTALDYMAQHFGEKLSLEDLAKAVSMSRSRFSHVFRREVGKSPGQHLIQVRLEKARKLLAAGRLSITDTALRCGFHGPSHLAGSFRRRYGVSPTQFRDSRIL